MNTENKDKDIEDSKKEIQRIQALDNENLLTEFESMIRNGAGTGYHKYIWFRKEVFKRMEYGELI